jgi:hypothetical protein
MMVGRPPLMPMGIAMSFELAAYGLVSGVMFMMVRRLLPKGDLWFIASLYGALVTAMMIGRIVFGLVMWRVLVLNGGQYAFETFITAVVIEAMPGIVLHILLIPVIVFALKKARFVV